MPLYVPSPPGGAPAAHHLTHETGGSDPVAALDGSVLTTGTVPDARLSAAIARIASPTFTGTPAAPTAGAGTSTTQIATTAFVTVADALKADLASPALTGSPTAPTQTPGDSSTKLATTAFVTTAGALKADLASPTFTGDPKAPTPATADNDTSVATTAFVKAQGYALAGAAPAAHHTSHESGGTDAVTLAESQVTNLTTDLAAKAPLASPALTGTPTAPTAAAGTNTTQVATTAFVQGAVAPITQFDGSTGTVNDFTLTTGVSVLRLTNASLLTLTGLSAGVDGQELTIISSGAGRVDLAHQNTGSAAANRLVNMATTAPSSLAPSTGTAVYRYVAASQRWRLISLNQGAWISQVYSGSDFTAAGSMTWTVDSGDLSVFKYWLKDTTLLVSVNIGASTLGGTASAQINIKVPGGFSFAGGSSGRAFLSWNNSADTPTADVGFCAFNQSIDATNLRCFKKDAST